MRLMHRHVIDPQIRDQIHPDLLCFTILIFMWTCGGVCVCVGVAKDNPCAVTEHIRLILSFIFSKTPNYHFKFIQVVPWFVE